MVKRRTLKQYMEWLLLDRWVRVNGEGPWQVTQVAVEGSTLIVHHEGGYSKYKLDDKLVIEKEDL